MLYDITGIFTVTTTINPTMLKPIISQVQDMVS